MDLLSIVPTSRTAGEPLRDGLSPAQTLLRGSSDRPIDAAAPARPAATSCAAIAPESVRSVIIRVLRTERENAGK